MRPLTRRRFIGTSAALAATATLGPAWADDVEFRLKVATVAPPGTPWAKQLRKLEKQVRERSRGRLQPKIHLGGSLGDEKTSAGRSGDDAGWAGSPSGLSDSLPEINAYELPFLFADERRARRATDGAKIQTDALLRRARRKLIFTGELGFHALGTPGPIRSPADLSGLRIATPPGSPRGRIWRALGARPQTVASKDTADALRRGRVDGFSAPPLFALGAGWVRAGMHITLLPMIYSPLFVLVSDSAFDRLSEADRAALTGDADARAREMREAVDRANREAAARISAAGATFARADAALKAGLAERTANVTAEFRRGTSAEGRALLDRLQR